MIIVLLLSGRQSKAADTIHLIIIADTKDVTINKSIQNNLIRIHRHIGRIAKNTQMVVKNYTFKGDSANSDFVWKSLQSLNFNSNDVVFFHYSGHGSNYAGQYPTLNLAGEKRLALEEIHQLLNSKRARLVLTFADCCNQINNRQDAFWRTETTANLSTLETKNHNQLFKESKGNILACSSKKGTVSYYSDNLGGYFTLSLFEALRQESQQVNKLTWDKVLRTAQSYTKQVAHAYQVTQEPFFEIKSKTPLTETNFISKKIDIRQPIIIEVIEGYNLSIIAKRFNVSLTDLRKWNNLSTDTLLIGQKIIIK